jgi:hypothetical protein
MYWETLVFPDALPPAIPITNASDGVSLTVWSVGLKFRSYHGGRPDPHTRIPLPAVLVIAKKNHSPNDPNCFRGRSCGGRCFLEDLKVGLSIK